MSGGEVGNLRHQDNRSKVVALECLGIILQTHIPSSLQYRVISIAFSLNDKSSTYESTSTCYEMSLTGRNEEKDTPTSIDLSTIIEF